MPTPVLKSGARGRNHRTVRHARHSDMYAQCPRDNGHAAHPRGMPRPPCQCTHSNALALACSKSSALKMITPADNHPRHQHLWHAHYRPLTSPYLFIVLVAWGDVCARLARQKSSSRFSERSRSSSSASSNDTSQKSVILSAIFGLSPRLPRERLSPTAVITESGYHRERSKPLTVSTPADTSSWDGLRLPALPRTATHKQAHNESRSRHGVSSCDCGGVRSFCTAHLRA